VNNRFLYILSGFIIYSIYQKYRLNVPIYYVNSIAANFNARTIPPFGIFIKKSESKNLALLNHELKHWEQFKKLGLLGFYSKYVSEHIKKGYDLNELEIEARSNESQYCKTNFTQCVRSGESNTVFNPNFRL
jgi:hypothetical protein